MPHGDPGGCKVAMALVYIRSLGEVGLVVIRICAMRNV